MNGADGEDGSGCWLSYGSPRRYAGKKYFKTELYMTESPVLGPYFHSLKILDR